MKWDLIQAGFLDELEKISSVSLSGLAPQTILGQPKPEPMNTPGMSKALNVLDRVKTAGLHEGLPPDQLPQFHRLRKRAPGPQTTMDESKSIGAHTLAGAGAGRFLGWISHGPKAPVTEAAKQALHGRQWWGTAIGAGVGAAEYGRKKLKARAAQKTASAALSGGNVGTVSQKLKTGPSVKAQVPLIGRKGSLPTVG